MRRLPFLLLVVLLGGCGGSGDLVEQAGISTTPAKKLDLTGTSAEAAIERSADPGDPVTQERLRDDQMLFRRIRGADGDVFMGVAEVTVSQWTRIAGSHDPADPLDDQPVTGLSIAEVEAALSAYNAARDFRLRLPTAAEWRSACGGEPFSWGAERDQELVAVHARVRETVTSATNASPQALALDQQPNRQPNAQGCYDLHGNLWEMTADGGFVGGSWHDGLDAARSDLPPAGFEIIDRNVRRSVAHPLVGLRLVLED